MDTIFENSESFTLKPEKLNLKSQGYSLDYLFDMTYIDSFIVVNEFPDPQFALKIIDVRNDSIHPFARKGKGPGEFPCQAVNYTADYRGNNLYIADKKKCYVFAIDSLNINAPRSQYSFEYNKQSNYMFHPVFLNSETVLGSLLDFQFGIFSMERDTVIKRVSYPKGGMIANQMFFVPHPVKSEVAYFSYSSSKMGKILYKDLLNTKVINLIDDESNLKMVSTKQTQKARLKKNAKNGFIAATASSHYIYVLYSGKVIDTSSVDNAIEAFLSDRIYVFDWDLKPICTYKLKCNVRSIAVDNLDETLYAASYDNIIPQLVKFDLK